MIAAGLGAGSLAHVRRAGSDATSPARRGWRWPDARLGAVAASGRAVFGWFPRDERGLALGLRQTAVPAWVPRSPRSRCRRWRRRRASTRRSMRSRGRCRSPRVAAAVWLRDGPRARVGRSAGARRRARPAHLAAERGVVADDHRADRASPRCSCSTCTSERAARAAATRRSRSAACRSAPRSRAWPPAAGPNLRDERIEPFRRLAPLAGVLLLAAAALAGPAASRAAAAGGRRRRDELERAVVHRGRRDLRPGPGRHGHGDPEHGDARGRRGVPVGLGAPRRRSPGMRRSR